MHLHSTSRVNDLESAHSAPRHHGFVCITWSHVRSSSHIATSIHLSLRLSFLFAVQIAYMRAAAAAAASQTLLSNPSHRIPSQPGFDRGPYTPSAPVKKKTQILLREARGNRANLPPVPPFSFRNQSRTHARTVCRVPTSQTQNQKPKKLAPNSKTTRRGGNPRKQNGPRAARGVHKTKDAVRAP